MQQPTPTAPPPTHIPHRRECVHFWRAHDDGQSEHDLDRSDLILVGVSRSGKTSTALYLATHYGLKVASYPLTPEDFERRHLPRALLAQKTSLILGLSTTPEHLSAVRNQYHPGSWYAAIDNCRMEISAAESMLRRYGIGWLSTANTSNPTNPNNPSAKDIALVHLCRKICTSLEYL